MRGPLAWSDRTEIKDVILKRLNHWCYFKGKHSHKTILEKLFGKRHPLHLTSKTQFYAVSICKLTQLSRRARRHEAEHIPASAEVLLTAVEGVVGPASPSSCSSCSTGCSGMGTGSPSRDCTVDRSIPSDCGLLSRVPSSSVEMAKRGMSRSPEQRRRTVKGGLESLSVCEDSDMDKRLRSLKEKTRQSPSVKLAKWWTLKDKKSAQTQLAHLKPI